jgi:m7GpppX diphosphatase
MQDFINGEIAKKRWIYKIIDGEQEQESIIVRTDDFVILPDTDSPQDTAVLNWIVIFSNPSLISMRCLRGEHVPMLQTVKDRISELVPRPFTSPMIYFHYPPSVWQLHLHVAAPCDILRTTNSMQKVCFLEDVICNLRIDSDYYAKATMTYIMPSNHELTHVHAYDAERMDELRPRVWAWTADVACTPERLPCPG